MLAGGIDLLFTCRNLNLQLLKGNTLQGSYNYTHIKANSHAFTVSKTSLMRKIDGSLITIIKTRVKTTKTHTPSLEQGDSDDITMRASPPESL